VLLTDRIADLEARLEKALRRNRELEIENRKLRKEVERWRRGHQSRKPRFSSKSEKAQPKANPKRPGRKAGHEGSFRPVPEHVDHIKDYAPPATCSCGGDVNPTSDVESILVEDIPEPKPVEVVRHVAHVGQCCRCGKRVHTPLPGQGKTMIGPRATALALRLRFRHRMTLRQMSRYFETTHGIRISPSGLSQIFARRAEQTACVRETIRAQVLSSPVVGGDETGFREKGKNGWLWLLQTPQASYFHLALSRGSSVFDALMPFGSFAGVLVTDFYGVYTRRKDVLHSYCGAHVIRASKAIAEVDPTPVTREFSDKIRALYKKGAMAQDFDTKESVRATFRWLTTHPRFQKHAEVNRLRKRMARRFEGIVAFLGRDDIPHHNNVTEREIRFACEYRKVTGGTQSSRGSQTFGHWLSVDRTLAKNGIDFDLWTMRALESVRSGSPLPSPLAQPP